MLKFFVEFKLSIEFNNVDIIVKYIHVPVVSKVQVDRGYSSKFFSGGYSLIF